MTAVDSVPFSAMLEENLASASPDVLRAMFAVFAGQLDGRRGRRVVRRRVRPER